MKHLTERIPFELAKKLKEIGYPQCRRDENYVGPKYTLDGQFTVAPYAKHYAAPTYAEALDWLFPNGYVYTGTESLMKDDWFGTTDRFINFSIDFKDDGEYTR